ncbi:MAG: hypothetical protein ISP56_02530 [Flavobacteriaceae bacterium]|nr:hypothetical protein [Flavobacteriaceae bacterium]
MKIFKWVLFILSSIICIISLVVVYLMYSNLSFIDYPYVISAVVSGIVVILAYRFKVT